MKLNKHITTKKLFWIGLIKKAVFCLFLFSASFSNADESNSIMDTANSEYAKGNYDKAIKLYQSIVDKNLEAPELYFNLGNAYYKSNNIAYSILNYERAKKLDPDNDDINFNLKLANQKIEDKIDTAPQLFLTDWKNGIVNITTEKGWSILLIITIIVSLILFSIYISTTITSVKKAGFFGGSILIIISVVFFFIARNKYEQTKYSSSAIITSASVTATGSPTDKGTKLFILHEGTKVNILQNESNWMEIKIPNGNVGWIKSNNLTSI